MRLLALETTTSAGSLAAFDGDRFVSQLALPSEQRSAQSLAPGILRLLREVGWRPADVQRIAVAAGPGSFTGLRVGVTTAKAMAYATGAQVLGVDSLAAVAWQAPPDVAELWCVMDAFRGQVFAARFRRSPEGWPSEHIATHTLDDDVWLARLAAGDIVSGPGLAKFRSSLPEGVRTTPTDAWSPTAVAVGRLAIRRFARGACNDLWSLLPRYHRGSAAEEKMRTGESVPRIED